MKQALLAKYAETDGGIMKNGRVKEVEQETALGMMIDIRAR